MEVMGMDNMTALVSAFARAYHYRNNHTWVFADPVAEKMLTDEEYTAISQNMSQGISFFAPEFRGTQEEALGYKEDWLSEIGAEVVNQQKEGLQDGI